MLESTESTEFTTELISEDRSTVAQALIIGLAAILISLIFTTALLEIVRTQTRQDLRQQILYECARRDDPALSTCVEEMRTAIDN